MNIKKLIFSRGFEDGGGNAPPIPEGNRVGNNALEYTGLGTNTCTINSWGVYPGTVYIHQNTLDWILEQSETIIGNLGIYLYKDSLGLNPLEPGTYIIGINSNTSNNRILVAEMGSVMEIRVC